MTAFEKEIYAGMKSEDRIALWMVKAAELREFSKILTDEDLRGLESVIKIMREDLRGE